MIISRTPLRVSFFGGGTDLRSYYVKQPGHVINTGIQNYLYVVLREQADFVEFPYRINWSQVEFCKMIDEIQHPVVREAYRMFGIDFPIELTTFSDIPAGTGLGSSSSFAVGLVNALHALRRERATKYSLAAKAAQIEIDILGRVMGRQDHFAAAYGSLNVYHFKSGDAVEVEPVFSVPARLDSLEKHLLLFYTGTQRNASEILEAQDAASPEQTAALTGMADLVTPMAEILSGHGELSDIGPMLHESWNLKRSISPGISTVWIDEQYELALAAGALGGKILGAGGGGFLMIFAEPDRQDAVEEALKPMKMIRPTFDTSGTRITYYEPSRNR